jgi:predicted amidohydrolase
LAELAEAVPDGPSTQLMSRLAQEHECFISFGLSEVDGGRYFISQLFVGPQGFIYRYRKSWLWLEPDDEGYRNEWARYDPGSGPESFDFDGVKATCFICADGEAPRCIQRVKALAPEVVFYPNNRCALPDFEVFGDLATTIGAPMLVTNRTGLSWMHNCMGGSVVYSASGDILAKSNRDGREDVLIHDLKM